MVEVEEAIDPCATCIHLKNMINERGGQCIDCLLKMVHKKYKPDSKQRYITDVNRYRHRVGPDKGLIIEVKIWYRNYVKSEGKVKMMEEEKTLHPQKHAS